jgi:RNA polymerase sigma factor (sigma-70 family)
LACAPSGHVARSRLIPSRRNGVAALLIPLSAEDSGRYNGGEGRLEREDEGLSVGAEFDTAFPVQTDPETMPQTAFAPTHWSIIAAAGETQMNPEAARAALADLCQTYWRPLYTFVRSRGYSVDDAQDLTQSFFAFFIERKIYERADREKGKFRSFLLASLKNFLADARDREEALKRGGGQEFLPLNEEQAQEAESLFQSQTGEHLFEQSWAETVVSSALEMISKTYKMEGKESLFEALRIFLAMGADPLPSYDQLGARLHMPASTLRSHVTRLRARYREALRAEVRRTVSTETEVDEELRDLLRVLACG